MLDAHLIPVIGPAALAAAALWPWQSTRQAADRIGAAAETCSLIALGAVFVTLLAGTPWLASITTTSAATGLVGVMFDALSATVLLLVCFVGWVVVRYSRRYLDGDPGQVRFFRWLCATLAAVLTLVMADNLVMLTGAWIATSLCLHKLLVFYPERPRAVMAARKKFIISRLGDLCMGLAVFITWQTFGTVHYGELFEAAEAARTAGTVPPAAHLSAILLVVAAVLKSAQFPFHGWLTEVMETPTPVSALLHAGIINAGGFLIIRLSPLVSLSAPSMDILAGVGAFTAFFAALVMLTQTSIKVSLAWSTIAQMGFMMLECGLGAFTAAALHLVAHSLYKAHAFLSSGTLSVTPARHRHGFAGVEPLWFAASLAGGIAIAIATGWAFGISVQEEPGILIPATVLVAAITQLIWQNTDGSTAITATAGRGVLAAAGVSSAYFALQRIFGWMLHDAVAPHVPGRDLAHLLFFIGVVAAFALVAFFNANVSRCGDSRTCQQAFIHLRNGLYINTAMNRMLTALWPVSSHQRSHQAEGDRA
jgi:NAD(P)H-quinone oxidoreductase subunit 5